MSQYHLSSGRLFLFPYFMFFGAIHLSLTPLSFFYRHPSIKTSSGISRASSTLPIMTSRLGSLALVFELLFSICVAVDNGLARTPAMGWVSSFLIGHGACVRVRLAHFAQNNWNTFGCKVSESLLLETASVLVETGLRDLGYQYVVLDDCWSHSRGEDGYLLADPQKFPRGMKAVAQFLHDNGLLFGMYSSAGELTCARYGELHAVGLCRFGLTPCSGLAGL